MNAFFDMQYIVFPPSQGDIKKNIEIVIVDDLEPEDSETLMVGLVKTAGGSRILPSSDTVTIIILANDNVAGVVGFHSASRSVIARKGECGRRAPVSHFNEASHNVNHSVNYYYVCIEPVYQADTNDKITSPESNYINTCQNATLSYRNKLNIAFLFMDL